MPHPQILVVGSLAFDVIFSIPHDFRQSVPLQDGEIRSFNATYVANEKNEHPGGTAGNIAVWLGTQNVPCSVFSAWGQDLETKGYAARLQKSGAELRGAVGEHTAACYSVSDPLHQQLVIWQPNHYEHNKTQNLLDHYSAAELAHFKYAIFSAGTPDSIRKHLTEFRQHNSAALVIFDPGQVTPIFTAEDFKACVELSDMVVGNDIEAQHFEGFMQGDWPESVQRVITLGDRGWRHHQTGIWEAGSAVKVESVVETTGAGDAFRAGLLAGLSSGQRLSESLALGAKLGAECVGLPAGQPV